MKTEYRKLEARVSVTRTGEECTYKTGMLWVDRVADRRS